jgi:4-oxalocrotonate tautomerase
MPLIQISQASQQSPEAKRNLVETMTQAYAQATGSDESKVWVIINEVPRENWGTGGIPLADRDQQPKA